MNVEIFKNRVLQFSNLKNIIILLILIYHRHVSTVKGAEVIIQTSLDTGSEPFMDSFLVEPKWRRSCFEQPKVSDPGNNGKGIS